MDGGRWTVDGGRWTTTMENEAGHDAIVSQLQCYSVTVDDPG